MFPLSAIPWRAVAAVAGVAGVALMGWRVTAWHGAYEALPGVREALAREEACADGSRCRERQRALEAAQAAKSKEVVDGYERELADVRGRPVPVRTVRLCPDRGNVPGARPARPADGPGAPAADVPEAPGRDLGPDLYQLARDADEIAARLRALQEWNRALAQE